MVTKTTMSKSSDQLIDILKQVQARKTVKPEDATKALQQYHKVLEHIKALKAEIELFKSNQAKQEDVQTKPQPKINVISRKNSIRPSGSVKQPTPATKPPSKNINGPPQMNGSVAIPSRGSRLPSKASMDVKNGKAQEKQPVRPVPKDDKQKEEKPGGEENPPSERDKELKPPSDKDKDKELARLRLQNAQMKVTLETKANKGPNSILDSDLTTKSAVLEIRDIPAPGKLVEEFKKIHDFEYKTAFHDLEHHYKLKEENITELLAGIAKEAYTFCGISAKQQFEEVTKAHAHVIDILVQPKYTPQFKDIVTSKSKAIIDKDGHQLTRRFLKDYRRSMAKVAVPGLIEIFENFVQRDVLSRLSSLRTTPKAAKPYIHKLIEVNWFMAIHEPQMAQAWPRGGQLMNREWFTAYNKKGATVIHTVWPALFYHKEGNIADRGICVVK